MNVTFHGPRGYDYQYYVSAYLILHFWNRDSLESRISEAFIDRAGHEDLLLAFTNDKVGKVVTLEVECKDRVGDFDEIFLRECLSKFTAGRDDSFILSRIHDDSLDFICFFSSARATSYIEELKLITSPNGILEPRKNVPKIKAAALSKNLEINFSKQADARGKFGASFLGGLAKDSFHALLERVNVVDQQSYEMVTHRMGIELNSLGVAEVNQKDAIERLYKLVKGSAKSGIDILPEVKEIVNSLVRRKAPLDHNYIHRPEESYLITELRKKHFLLLEGNSLCGKTQIAYALANQLLKENESFEYQVKMDIVAADQFLFEKTTGGKICYLEDPFGHFLHAIDFNLVRKLSSLIDNVGKAEGKLLICTCNSEITAHIKDSSPNLNPWHGLNITDRSFLINAWTKFADIESVRGLFFKQVKQLLEILPENELFQLGQLRALASLKESKDGLNREQIKNKANIKAQDVAQFLRQNTNLIKYMLVLGAAATTQTGISDSDLYYILDGSPDYFPGFNKTDPRSIGGVISFGDERPEYKLKRYRRSTETFNLAEIHDGISALIDLNYIAFADNQYFFAHPIYQEAARLLLADKNVLRFSESLKMLKKVIGGLNEKAALQAVKSLYIVFDGQRNEEEKRKLLDIAEAAGRSTFVTVRDESALFLADKFRMLAASQQKDFIRTFRRKSDFTDNIFRWDGDVVFIPEVDSIAFNTEFLTYAIDREELQENWNQYVREKAVLSSKSAFMLLSRLIHLAEHQPRVNFDIPTLKVFLEYQQLFIREMAAFLIAASLDDDTFAVLDNIVFEDNPYIKYQIIRGLFRSYPYFIQEEVRDNAGLFLRTNFDDLFVVIRAIPFFTQFASAHASDSFDWTETITLEDKKQMWELWGGLMPIFFKQLPVNVHISFGRFTYTLLEARVQTKDMAIILIAYASWLRDKLIEQSVIPDFADIFINVFYHYGPQLKSPSLCQLVEIAVQVQIPLFREKFIRTCVSLWSKFDEPARLQVLNFLDKLSYRGKIMAFTTKDAPEQVQQIVTGRSITNLKPEEVVAEIPEKFILDCLINIYELHETSEYHLVDRNFWGRVLNIYLTKPHTTCFQIAFHQYLQEVCIFEKIGSYFPKNTVKYLKDLMVLTDDDEQAIAVILEVLSKLMLDSDHEKIRTYAEIVLDNLSEDHRNHFVLAIKNNLCAFGREDNLRHLPAIINPYVEPLLQPELELYHLQKSFKETRNPSVGYEIKDVLLNGIEAKRYNIPDFMEMFLSWAKKYKRFFEEGQIDKIQDYNNYLFDLGFDQQMALIRAWENRLRELSSFEALVKNSDDLTPD